MFSVNPRPLCVRQLKGELLWQKLGVPETCLLSHDDTLRVKKEFESPVRSSLFPFTALKTSLSL